MKISVYTRDGRRASSSYYRIFQYFDQIKMMEGYKVRFRIFCHPILTKLQYNTNGFIGIIVRLIYHLSVFISSLLFFSIDVIRPADCIILLRSVTPKTCFGPVCWLYNQMLKRSKKVIWDFDDDIFKAEIGEKEKSIILSNVNDIVVTHDYLKSLLPKELHNITHILPTTDGDFSKTDFADNIIKRQLSFNQKLIIVWLASSAGLDDINEYASAIDLASEKIYKELHKSVVLYAICNRPVTYRFTNTQLINAKWSRKRAIELLSNAHVGIMPLRKTEYNLGKGGFKMIQYYAAELPAVGSNVGYNTEVISEGNTGFLAEDDNGWIRALFSMASDKEKWIRMCQNAKCMWDRKYNYIDNLNFWIDLLKHK